MEEDASEFDKVNHDGATKCAATSDTAATPIAMDAAAEPEANIEVGADCAYSHSTPRSDLMTDASLIAAIEDVHRKTIHIAAQERRTQDIEIATTDAINSRASTDATSTIPPTAPKSAAVGHADSPAEIELAKIPASPFPETTGKGGHDQKRKKLIPITTGAEPMQARARELYDAFAGVIVLSEFELRTVGPAISLEGVSMRAVKAAYLAQDAKYQNTLAAPAENQQFDVEGEQFRAQERVRKCIGRALRDLMVIGAVDVDGAGNPIALHRLPHIRRMLAEKGATFVRLSPGGKRLLCDAEGREIQLMPLTGTDRFEDNPRAART